MNIPASRKITVEIQSHAVGISGRRVRAALFIIGITEIRFAELWIDTSRAVVAGAVVEQAVVHSIGNATGLSDDLRNPNGEAKRKSENK